MTKILVYDVEAEDLEKIADTNDISVADVVEMLMAYAEEMRKDNNLKQGDVNYEKAYYLEQHRP